MSKSSTASSRSSSPTLTVSSSGGLYVPVHKRLTGSSVSSSGSSRTFPSGSSCSSSFMSSSDSDSVISPPATPAFIYSRDTLLNLANSPFSRMPKPRRDSLRSRVPQVMTNRRQRKAIDHFNHINAVQTAVALRVLSPTRSSQPNGHRQSHNQERTSKPVIV